MEYKFIAKLGLDKSEFDKGIDDSSKKASSIGGIIKNGFGVAAAAIGAATTAVVGFAGASVNAGMDFDKSMSQVGATMGKTAGELEAEVGAVSTSFGEFSGNLREFAQFMGSNTAFSATQAADALNYMALAGYSTQESMEMLPNVLSLAAAGSMDLARASDMVTDTQSAFGLSAERTTQMVDEMAKAASTGNTSVSQLGEAFLVVGGLAKELNGGLVTLDDGTEVAVDGIQEMEIALTAMANAGVKGSEAGTHMRNMIMKLSSPTKDGAEALEKMGVSVFDTEGKMRSLAGIFGDLNTALGSMTQEEKMSVISDLFNARDLASAEALLGAIGQDWNEIGASILDSKDAASQMAATQLDNLAGDITLFKSALEGAQIAISDGLTPDLREFVQFGTNGISELTQAFNEGGVSGAMEKFGEILSEGLSMLIEKLPEFVEAGAKLLDALLSGVSENLPMIADAAVEIITKIATYLIQSLPTLIDGAVEIVLALADGIVKALPQLIPAIVDVVLKIVDTLTDPDTLSSLIDVALEINLALANGIIDNLPKIIEKMPEIVENIMNALIENAPKLLKASFELIKTLIRGIRDNLPKLLDSASDIVFKILEGIVMMLGELIKAGKEIVDSVKDGFSQKVEDAKKWGADLINNFVNGIKEKWESLKTTVANVAQSVSDFLGFSEPKKGPLSNFHTFAPDMMELFAKGIRDNTHVVTDQIAKSFDFGEPEIGFSAGIKTHNTLSNAFQGTATATNSLPPIDITLKLDGATLARMMWDYNKNEGQLRGVSFA